MRCELFSRALLAALLAGACLTAGAQASYPNRTVIIQSPGSAGGFTDTVARLIAAGLLEKWKVNVIVENKSGAGGTLGPALAARQPPDGYYLLVSNTASDVISPSIFKKLSYDSLEDFEPIILAVKAPVVLLVNNEVPAKTLHEFIALAKANPGVMTYGFPANGSTGHLAGALFAEMAGVQLAPIPYKGTQGLLTGIISGDLKAAFDNAGLWAPHIRAGKVRALAISSLRRSPLLPEVPTFNELGVSGYEAITFGGLSAPHGTPRAIVDKINRDVQSVIDSSEFRSKMGSAEVVTNSPQDYRQFLISERAKWAAITKRIGLVVN